MALSAVELLVSAGKAVPDSMVLTSPALDDALSNPNIAFINDPVLNLPELQQDALLWAGDLPLTNPLVSRSMGRWRGFRRPTSTPGQMNCSPRRLGPGEGRHRSGRPDQFHTAQW